MSGRRASRPRTLLAGRTDRTEIQLLRSAAASHLGFWADFSALALLTEIIGLYYLVSALLASMWFLTEVVTAVQSQLL